MDLIEAIILGIIQGLTEFLPVSSSGHIELGKALFDIQEKEAGLLFTVILHVATALSTVIVFWKDILSIFKDIFKFKWNEGTKFAALIVVSMIPAVLVGLFFEEQLEEFFDGNVLMVSLMLLLTGGILFWSDKAKNREGMVTTQKAAVVGIVQAIAILPGISRSGSTIASSILLGISREKAARFSFLMVIPLIFGAMAKKIKDYTNLPAGEQTSMVFDLPVIAGFLAALIFGYLACKWMIAIVKKSKLSYFAYYCWIIGLIGIVHSLSSM